MTELGAQFRQLAMFATPKEIGEMNSGDHGYKPVRDVRPDMEEMHQEIGRKDPSGSRHPHLQSYLSAMTAHVERAGGIEVPAVVRNYTSGVTGEPAQALENGHHRALIAMATNRLTPVLHYEGNGDFRAAQAAREEGHRLEGDHEYNLAVAHEKAQPQPQRRSQFDSVALGG